MSLLGEDWVATGFLIRDTLRSDVALLQKVNDAILSNPGKMLRPMLTLLTARACCGSAGRYGESVRFAAAVEILHNATLLHDDVADDSNERRGVPTVKSFLGSAPAVLIGDYWLAKAVNLILETSHVSWATKEFAGTLVCLSEGEMLQQQKALDRNTSEEDYYTIIYDKTAALFALACNCGAMSVDAPAALREEARKYGVELGMAFQIRDDILDFIGEDTGKPLGTDIREGKMTLPLLGALKNGAYRDRILGHLPDAASDEKARRNIIQMVVDAGGIEYASSCLDERVSRSREHLSCFPDCEEKTILEEISSFVAKRDR